jgi:hypothetical protein
LRGDLFCAAFLKHLTKEFVRLHSCSLGDGSCSWQGDLT